MNFLYAFISVFLTNYLCIWIISLFSTKYRKLISAIVISLFNISSIIYSIYDLWQIYLYAASQNQLQEYTAILLVGVGNLLAPIFAYAATLLLLLDGRKIFKSRRQQQYRNALKSGFNKQALIAIIILSLLGIGSLVYAIIITMNYSFELLLAAVGAYGMTIIFFGVAYYIFYINFTKQKNLDTTSTNSNIINANIINKTKVDVILLFILQLGVKKYYFTGSLENNKTINDYLGNILNIYVLTDFGNINTPDKKYIVKGIKVDKISEETLREIKMERIMPDEKMLNILSNFQRYHLKNIYLDENNNVVKIIER